MAASVMPSLTPETVLDTVILVARGHAPRRRMAIDAATRLDCEMGLDSLDMVDLVLDLEIHFRIDLPEAVTAARTIGDLAGWVCRQLGIAAPGLQDGAP